MEGVDPEERNGRGVAEAWQGMEQRWKPTEGKKKGEGVAVALQQG